LRDPAPALTGPAERPDPAPTRTPVIASVTGVRSFLPHPGRQAAAATAPRLIPRRRPSLPRLVRTSSEFVVGHIRGIELTRKPAYLADRSRESSTATTPLSPVERMRRPAPWARRRAACVADTAMN